MDAETLSLRRTQGSISQRVQGKSDRMGDVIVHSRDGKRERERERTGPQPRVGSGSGTSGFTVRVDEEDEDEDDEWY